MLQAISLADTVLADEIKGMSHLVRPKKTENINKKPQIKQKLVNEKAYG